MKRRHMLFSIGDFAVTGDKLVVSDPCYELHLPHCGKVENVLPGRWLGFVLVVDAKSWGERVAELHALHADHADKGDDAFDWEDAGFEVGVDSGQAGVFDEAQYPKDRVSTGEYGDLHTFYGRCCDVTLNGHGKAIAEGLVSSSGFGDGGYPAYVARDSSGKVVAVKVIFIGEEDDEE